MRKIFVFGSNLAGKHNGGSAKAAVDEHGAIIGQGIGLQGDSYAIPTLNANFEKLPLPEIAAHVANFLSFARHHRPLHFDVVAIGCGIAGFMPAQIAPMFKGHSINVHLPQEFIDVLEAAC